MFQFLFMGLLLASLIPQADAATRTLVVCPADAPGPGCNFEGGSGIQAAVDAASNGDTIVLRPGRYLASAFRDVPFKIHTIRGFVVVADKTLTIAAEPGAVLDGSAGPPTTAIVAHRADLTVNRLTITGFRYDQQDDEIYEGHGLFAIDSRVRIDEVTIERFQKMGLTGRGATLIDASRLRLLDGHVAIWLRESAYLRLRDSLVRGNDGSGVAAYAQTAAHIANCVFDGNLDDGLYTDDQATIFVANSLVLNSKPIGANAVGSSRILIDHGGMFGNQVNVGTKDQGQVTLGAAVVTENPRLDANYRPRADSPLIGKGDPELGVPVGLPLR